MFHPFFYFVPSICAFGWILDNRWYVVTIWLRISFQVYMYMAGFGGNRYHAVTMQLRISFQVYVYMAGFRGNCYHAVTIRLRISFQAVL